MIARLRTLTPRQDSEHEPIIAEPLETERTVPHAHRVPDRVTGGRGAYLATTV